MRDDANYKIGIMETQVTETRNDVVELKQYISEMQKDIKEIKTQLITWKSTAAGAITILIPVLSLVGAVVIWLGNGFIDLIRTKLG